MELEKKRIYQPVQVRGAEGFVETSLITNAPDGEGVQASLTEDYYPERVDGDGSFMIVIESADDISVRLIGQPVGQKYTITTAQATAYLGKLFPAKLACVYKEGTSGSFSVVF